MNAGMSGLFAVTDPQAGKKGSGKAELMGPQLADVGYYEQMLERARLLAAQQDALREYSKAQELAYWRDVLQSAELAGKDRVAIQRKVIELETQLLREQARQQQGVDAERLKGRQQAALDVVELARHEADAQVAQGQLSMAQRLELEREFEARRTEIQREFLQARLALIDPARDPVAYEQGSQAIEELERQHQLRLHQIQAQQAALAISADLAFLAAGYTLYRALSKNRREVPLGVGFTPLASGASLSVSYPLPAR